MSVKITYDEIMLDQRIIETEFNLDPDIIYLNHAAVGVWPTRTRMAVEDFAQQNAARGAAHYLQWMETESALRRQFAQLINAPSQDDIALLKNTSEALSFVANGLEWHAGDNVVISDQEFSSNRIVWQQLERLGVALKEVDLASAPTPEIALTAAIDSHTRLLSISSVQYASGLRMNLEQLGDVCAQKQILFCVDAIQSLGALQFDVQAIQADFVMADTHKWMLGPEGVALFYINEANRKTLQLSEFGWHMLEEPGNYSNTDWKISRSARRFECGSPNMLGIHAAHASLSLLLELGIASIEQGVLETTQFMHECLSQFPHVQILSSQRREQFSGIVTFNSERLDAQSLYSVLMKQNIICAHRGGGVRFSPHFYTDKALIKDAIQIACLTD